MKSIDASDAGSADRCWQFIYRTPEREVRDLLPPTLRLFTRSGFAFWHLEVAETAEPPARRNVGYYLRVTKNGVVGLYPVRRDWDSAPLSEAPLRGSLGGSADVEIQDEGTGRTSIRVRGKAAADADILVDISKRPELAWDSPFATIKEAVAELLKPGAVFSASTAAPGENPKTVPGSGQAWKHRPVSVPYAYWKYLENWQVAPELACSARPELPDPKPGSAAP